MPGGLRVLSPKRAYAKMGLTSLGGRAMTNRRRYCDGVERRDFLRLGAAGLFGAGFGLPALLEGQARAAEKGTPGRDVSLIFLFLHGGLSTTDTWDLKPPAPA